MNSNLGIGLVGSGFMARTYAECLAKYTHGASLRAVFGGRRAPALAADYGLETEASMADLLARPDINAVIITSPEMAHHQQTIAAAEKGKHVLVEKPMAANRADCEAMITGCDEAGIKLMVVQSQRFRGAHQLMHNLLREGRIGILKQIRHWALYPLDQAEHLARTRPFYLDEAGGGLLMGYAVHCFDLVRWIAGDEVQSIYALVGGPANKDITNLSLMAQLTFINGIMSQLWWSAELPGEPFPNSTFHTQLVGTKGLLDCDGYGAVRLSTDGQWRTLWEQPPFDLADPRDPVRLEAYGRMVQEFIDAINEGRPPSVTGEDGLAAVKLCQAAVQSAQQRKVIAL